MSAGEVERGLAAGGAARKLHAEGLSPYKISADLKARGTPLSHMTVRKVIAGRRSPAP